ncbi:MAG: hypothetical protein IKC43_01395 [Clostridia bacterium]|nr:hypothetical protein [Clostridia bacterium]
MIDLKKFGRAVVYPHKALLAVLTPIAAALLLLAAVLWDTDSFPSILAYVASAYTLTVWCFRIPSALAWFKRFKVENRYARRWREDMRLRMNVSLYASLAWNTLYGVFQFWLGIYHGTFWFFSLGAYHIALAVMRFFLVCRTGQHAPGERQQAELENYRACGILFLVMNLALALIIFFMVYWNRTFTHHMITAIAMAAYTFTALTVAVINVVKYRKYHSPAYSAAKVISLAEALVSMLTLESTMLTTFGDGEMTKITQKWLLGATGGAISLLIVATATHMIVTGTRKLKKLITEVGNGKQ